MSRLNSIFNDVEFHFHQHTLSMQCIIYSLSPWNCVGLLTKLITTLVYDHKVAAITLLSKLFDCLIEALFELRLTWVCSVCK